MNKVVKFSVLVGLCAFLTLFPTSFVFADDIYLPAEDDLLSGSYYYQTEDNVVYNVYSDANVYVVNYGYSQPSYEYEDTYVDDSGYYVSSSGSARRSKAQMGGDYYDGGSNSTSAIESALEAINARRARVGVAPLSFDKTLNRAAAARVKELAVSFSHVRPNGGSAASIITEYGGDYGYAGENVAYGMSSPEEVVYSWGASSSHNSCMLSSSYSRAGIGTVTAGGETYWVLIVTD